ncbi:PFDN1 [Cordylochernes scorpioides]|uniref:PFDN1 n=1 Tax=Cordylochernes scorpioides TaxID=51811 RepID=A0ABY6LCF6_9ARAC|nr:PFDN1 [Cordylochernes scorpioides]
MFAILKFVLKFYKFGKDRKAQSRPVDMELKKAFQELQIKMIDTTQKLQLADTQIDAHKRTIQRSQLTDSELSQMPPDTPMYLGIGRMFLRTDPTTVKKELEEKIKTCESKIKTMESNKNYLEKNMRESETNLREMIINKQKNL